MMLEIQIIGIKKSWVKWYSALTKGNDNIVLVCLRTYALLPRKQQEQGIKTSIILGHN